MLPLLRAPRSLAAALALMLVPSCENPVCACPPGRPPQAVLYGRVTDPAGTPLPGAAVSVELREGGCEGAAGLVGRQLTGADGGYSVPVDADFIRPDFCMRAHAAPPSGRDLWSSDTIPVAPLFGATTAPPDSARADFQVRAIWP